MASVTDADGVHRARERQRELLAAADIAEADREAIEKYTRHRRVHGSKSGDYSISTETSDLKDLRLSAERMDGVALVEAGLDDVNELLDTLTDPEPPKDDDGRTWRSQDYTGIEPGREGYGWGVGGGIDAYARALRSFYKWADVHDEYGEFAWYREINTSTVDFPSPSERRFPTEDEIEAMISAARENQSPRDVALLSFFADTAVRRTLGTQLLVGGISFGQNGSRSMFTPNAEGEAQKGVEIKGYPMYDCVAELRVWINQYHPDPENDDAPLWTHPAEEYRKRRDPSFCHRNGCRLDLPDEPETCPECGKSVYDDGAITTRQVARLIKKYAERAGLDTDEIEVKPHSFRHAAIGRWKERGYTLTQVQRRTAWKDKAAAEMWGEYGDPDDSKVDDKIDEIEGRATPEAVDDADDTAAPTPEPRTCGNCKAEEITADYCPDCGAAVSDSARAEQDADAEASEFAQMLNAALVDGEEAAIGALAEAVAGELSEGQVSSIASANAAALDESPDDLR